MLPLKNRLKNKKDFDEVFKKGKGAEGFFLFLKTKNNGLNESRFGFIVSRKVSKKAVIRNKIKRKLRAATGSRTDFIKKGLDVVVFVKKGGDKKELLEMEKELVFLFEKIKILNGGD